MVWTAASGSTKGLHVPCGSAISDPVRIATVVEEEVLSLRAMVPSGDGVMLADAGPKVYEHSGVSGEDSYAGALLVELDGGWSIMS